MMDTINLCATLGCPKNNLYCKIVITNCDINLRNLMLFEKNFILTSLLPITFIELVIFGTS